MGLEDDADEELGELGSSKSERLGEDGLDNEAVGEAAVGGVTGIGRGWRSHVPMGKQSVQRLSDGIVYVVIVSNENFMVSSRLSMRLSLVYIGAIVRTLWL